MRRYIWLVCLVIFVLMSSGLALAQDNMQDVFCGSLSDDDCALMGRSENFAMTSAKIDLNLDVTMTIDDGTQSFNMQASGAFVADPDIFASLKDMQQPMTTFEQIKALVEILRGVDSELALNINPPASMAELPSGVDSIALEVKLVDGVGYVNMDTLAPLMGDAGEDEGMQGWGGLDIVGLLDTLIEERPEMFEALGMTAQPFDPEAFAQFENPERIKDFVDIQRTSADDAPVVVFETTVDLASMIEDPAFTDLIRQAMEAQFQAQPGMSAAERQQAMELSLALVKSMTIVVTQSVDRETAAPVSFNIAITMDGSDLPASAEIDLMSMGVDMMVAFDEVNAVESIAAPEDANIMPTQGLLGMMGDDSD